MVKLGPGTFFVGEGEDLDSIFKTLSLAIRLRVHTCIGPLQTLTGEVLRSPETVNSGTISTPGPKHHLRTTCGTFWI